MGLSVYLLSKDQFGVCSSCSRGNIEPIQLYHANITHNLTEMARAAGLYAALWEPEAMLYYNAEDIIDVLEEGLKKLESDPERYSAYNAPNGWGTYEHFVPFVRDYLEACRKYPEAKIVVDR